MTRKQMHAVNTALFLGLVALSLFTIRAIVILWPSAAGDPCVSFCGIPINMEKRYFLLVTLGGVLGSFIHVGTSYVDFLGNKKMVYSWVPWYLMRPFIGASLALVFYMLLRGGIVSTQQVLAYEPVPVQPAPVMSAAAAQNTTAPGAGSDSLPHTDTLDPKPQAAAHASSTPITPAETPGEAGPAPTPKPEPALPFNPFGIMAIACLTGLFSKQATDKLREVFESLFNIKKPTERTDPLNGSGQSDQSNQTQNNQTS